MNNFPLSRKSPRSLVAVALALSAPIAFVACGDKPAAQTQFVPSTQITATQTPRPDYPLEVACAGVGGTVVLTVTVGIEGKPTEVLLVQSSGNATLDKSALERVPSWQFNPATRNGKPVPLSIQVPVNFKPPAVRPDECFKLDEKS